MAARKKSRVGGPRKGAGRPPGTGPGPSPDARRNRVAVMFSDKELANLRAEAKRRDLPVSTVAHLYVARALKRHKKA